ncbi:DUF5719 family protein [Arthrobacter sp. 35W]|uniref:DUF5719 family protein n=1 Tax=Arthrobacter sp. 35W TaxID=1132441 RepID=UPI0003F5E39E|nr:DUF5719 family protein [Arthrobacter sp. 35W]
MAEHHPTGTAVDGPPAANQHTPEAATKRSPRRGGADGQRPRRRTVWLAAAAGAGTAILAGAVVAGSALVPALTAGGAASLEPVVLPVGQSVASCAGPTQLLSGADVGSDPQFSAASANSASNVSALLLGSESGAFGAAVLSSLDGAANAATVSTQSTSSTNGGQGAKSAGPVAVDAPSVLRADPVDGVRAPAAAIVASKNDDGDLRGLAAAPCQTPSNDLWIAGASTTVGRTAVLNIANASQTAATVNLDLFGAAGPVQAPGARGLLVPAGTTRAIVLAGLAAGEEGLSVHLKSTGGPVTAVVQQSVLRGLTPGGVDFLSPVNVPAQRQVVAGVRLPDTGLAARISAQNGYADAAPSLQVTVPGTKDAVVQVKVLGSGGQQALPNGGVFTARAGAVTALALSGLPGGDYALDISADTAFTATAKVSVGAKEGEPVDLSYAPAAARLGDGQLVVLPRGIDSKLSFAAPTGAAKITLTPVATGGALLAAKTVQVDGGRSVTVDPSQLVDGAEIAGFVLSATGDAVYGAQLLASGTMASVASVPRAGSSAQTLKVVLGY